MEDYSNIIAFVMDCCNIIKLEMERDHCLRQRILTAYEADRKYPQFINVSLCGGTTDHWQLRL